MAYSVSLKADQGQVMPSGKKARQSFEYKNGERTDTPRKSADGRNLYRMDAVVAINGSGLGEVSLFTSQEGAELLGSATFGEVFDISHMDGIPVTVAAQDQFNVRVTVEAMDLSPVSTGK